MQITITARDAGELRSKILDLSSIFGGTAVVSQTADPAQMSFPAEYLAQPVDSPLPGPVAAKRGAKAKGKTDEVAASAPPSLPVQELQIPKPPEVIRAPPQKSSRDEARAALEKLNEIKGLEVARSVLTKYEAKRLSELQDEKLGEFIQSCNDEIQKA